MNKYLFIEHIDGVLYEIVESSRAGVYINGRRFHHLFNDRARADLLSKGYSLYTDNGIEFNKYLANYRQMWVEEW